MNTKETEDVDLFAKQLSSQAVSIGDGSLHADMLSLRSKPGDFTIEAIDKVEVSAHGIILSMRSLFFANILEQGLYQEGMERRIASEYTSFQLNLLLDFIYTEKLDSQHAMILAVMGNYYGVSALQAKSIEALSKSINASNVVNIMCFAEDNGFDELEKKAVAYASMHMKQLRGLDSKWPEHLTPQMRVKVMLACGEAFPFPPPSVHAFFQPAAQGFPQPSSHGFPQPSSHGFPQPSAHSVYESDNDEI